ncbi:hypothetical protein EUX98_g2213 [Antrodiella citrinella]|uniref:Fork-head domain-containing protein n=1 Tax=Antrodiella citrinella TaxID=2447956 RepID=A0A4S4N2C8_9APHY|nr:hypothetical protein EUX98_g2213 [Antrodiella citrinella]
MASLNTLLNPQNTFQSYSAPAHPSDTLPPTTALPPATPTPTPTPARLDMATVQSDDHSAGSPSPDGELESLERATSSEPTYYQSELLSRSHPKHDNCPDTLDCLPDTDGRPQHTLPVILRCAILGSPKKRLTIREIYAAMEKKYAYYTTAGPAWKQSVRHHLSLNRLFERQPRPATEPGFGSYWTVNLLAPPGTKRPRKRGGRKKAANGEPLPPDPPKKPEHPQRLKDKLKELQESAARVDAEPPMHPNATSASTAAATGTLRPVDAHSFSHTAMRAGRGYDDVDEDDLTLDDGQGGTEDDYESEDSSPYQYDHHLPPPPSPPSHSSHHASHPHHAAHPSYPTHPEHMPPRTSYPQSYHPSRYQPYPRASPGGLHGAFSSPSYPSSSGSGLSESVETKLDRMQKEIDALKRQSTDAHTMSMRMSDQLADAQAEASRSKASLRVVESRLEDERRRRKEAEMMADDESKIRRSVEDKLLGFQLQSQSSRSYHPSSKQTQRSLNMQPPSPS